MTNEANEIKGLYFPVLDHGFVALKDWMGGDQDVIEAARVSYGFGTKKTSDDRGLIRYLMRHYHSTPFEMVEMKFHMKLPIFVARQLIRHRTANVNEFSGRYSLMPMLFYTPKIKNFSVQSKTNRQGRQDWANLTPSEKEALQNLYTATTNRWEENRKSLSDQYEDLVNEGVARELARIDLPLSMYTEWYWKLDLHNLFHFLRLRSDSHAQWEIRQFSDLMAGMVKRVAPLAFEAWRDYRFDAVNFSYQESQLLWLMMNPEYGGELNEAVMANVGLSKREIEEFKHKIPRLGKRDRVSFDLDLSTAKPASFFYEEAQAAVPEVDQ